MSASACGEFGYINDVVVAAAAATPSMRTSTTNKWYELMEDHHCNSMPTSIYPDNIDNIFHINNDECANIRQMCSGKHVRKYVSLHVSMHASRDNNCIVSHTMLDVAIRPNAVRGLTLMVGFIPARIRLHVGISVRRM